MEIRLHFGLQVQLDDGLRDPICDRGHSQHPDAPSTWLRYLYHPHRRREVAPRGHPIPELVQVPFQVLLVLFDRLPVDSGGPSIAFTLR